MKISAREFEQIGNDARKRLEKLWDSYMGIFDDDFPERYPDCRDPDAKCIPSTSKDDLIAGFARHISDLADDGELELFNEEG